MYWSKWGLGMVLIAAGPIVSAAEDTPLELIRRSNQAVLEMIDGDGDLDLQTESRVFEIMEQVTSFDTIATNAVEEIPPFKKEDRGFKDELIVLSLIEYAQKLESPSAILETT